MPCNGDARHHVWQKIQPSYTDAKIMIFFAIGGIFDRVFTKEFLNVGARELEPSGQIYSVAIYLCLYFSASNAAKAFELSWNKAYTAEPDPDIAEYSAPAL